MKYSRRKKTYAKRKPYGKKYKRGGKRSKVRATPAFRKKIVKVVRSLEEKKDKTVAFQTAPFPLVPPVQVQPVWNTMSFTGVIGGRGYPNVVGAVITGGVPETTAYSTLQAAQFDLNAHNVIFPLQGTDSNNRIGNQIRVVKMGWKMHFTYSPGYADPGGSTNDTSTGMPNDICITRWEPANKGTAQNFINQVTAATLATNPDYINYCYGEHVDWPRVYQLKCTMRKWVKFPQVMVSTSIPLILPVSNGVNTINSTTPIRRIVECGKTYKGAGMKMQFSGGVVNVPDAMPFYITVLNRGASCIRYVVYQNLRFYDD